MKRNKHTNVVSEEKEESNSFIIPDKNGKLVKASGIQFAKDFANIVDKITTLKGGKIDEGTKALLEMTQVWTPDMAGNNSEPLTKKPKRTRKKADSKSVDEKPKCTRKKKENI